MHQENLYGVLTIDGIDYLTYHISKKHDNRYINLVLYDIQKEQKYRNIIILTHDINRVNIDGFVFGKNQVLIIEDNEINREKLKYIHRINWPQVINDYYWFVPHLSEYSFCDYTDHKNKYISTFYYIDAEKIYRIKQFLRENNNKTADIICSKELKERLTEEIPNAHYITVDIDKYIDKEQNIYD